MAGSLNRNTDPLLAWVSLLSMLRRVQILPNYKQTQILRIMVTAGLSLEPVMEFLTLLVSFQRCPLSSEDTRPPDVFPIAGKMAGCT